MQENRFCTQCGAELPEDATFCPECGAMVGSGGKDAYCSPEPVKKGPSFGFLILIYGVIAILFGLMNVISGLGMTEEIYNDILQQVTEATGMDAGSIMPAWTENTGFMMALSMACLTVSGVIALWCFLLCKKAHNWKAAVILCAASSIACLGMCCYPLYSYMGIPLLVIGLIMTFLLYGSRDNFYD